MRSHASVDSTNNGTPKPPTPSSASRPPSRHSAVGEKSRPANPNPVISTLKKKISIGIFSAAAASSQGAAKITPHLSSAGKTRIAAATSSRARPSTDTAARTPLRPRDHNVVPAPSRHLSSSTRNAKTFVGQATPAKMPPATNANSAPTRQPQMPSLSTAAVKAMNRGGVPLTPKIAAGRAQQQTVTIATPLPRRAQRPDSTPSSTVGSGRGDQKDDFASPMAAFLSSNITPRSGTRQSRVDSANSTPTGTPNPDRSEAWETRSGLGISGSDVEGGGMRRQGVAFSPQPPELGRQDPDAKFFYASDARTMQQTAQQTRPYPATQPKGPAFFYASGESVPEKGNPSPVQTPFTPVLGGSQDNFSAKFVFANGMPDMQPSLKPFPPSGPGSTVSMSSRLAAGRSATANQGIRTCPPQRPASPVKMSQPVLKNGATPPLAASRHLITTAAPPPASSTATLRRTSVDTPSRGPETHSRSGSLTTAEPPAISRLISQQAQHQASPRPSSHPSSESPSPIALSHPHVFNPSGLPAINLASLLQAADDFVPPSLNDSAAETDSATADALHSPTKSSHSDAQLNELVASARRERKVQDLEITNASLEAINRTLERQLRKQTAELRRYRRLSRSGRLSLASLAERENQAGRTVSGSSAGGGALARAGMGVDDLSEDDDENSGIDEDSEPDSEDSEESDSGSGPGTAGLRPRDAALRSQQRRQRDERRLQLDLSKHQQLLVDSQKMNQSLKRCLGWTEELIKEGRRALQFKVRVSEVEIGGRVLPPVDEEGDGDADGEHSGGYVFEGEAGLSGENGDAASTSGSDGGKLDRDSAVELLAGDGS